uniref:Uncharacterized protein n=1 Tax=Anguilla anguilla TaxID=7936 RepID=A0A0E9RNH1_ANGAN
MALSSRSQSQGGGTFLPNPHCCCAPHTRHSNRGTGDLNKLDPD